MIVCGLKLTHDGAIALLDGNKLVFSVEMEKLDNNRRYSPVADLEIVPRLLADFGYLPAAVDHWVVDGWDGVKTGGVSLLSEGQRLHLVLAPYRENDAFPNLLQPAYRGELPIAGELRPYTSYVHLAGHVVSAYCSSAFAARAQPAFVLAWDGGTFPRLYYVDPARGIENGGELFPLIGHAYAMAAHHFGPYRRDYESDVVDDLSVAGKLMAYIALGTARPEIIEVLRETFHQHFEARTPEVAEFREAVGGYGSHAENSHRYVHAFLRDVRARAEKIGAADEDVLASVHLFLERLLVERVTAKIRQWRGAGPWNLCFVGGCALNIKWNSALRADPLFQEVWVPPFPNDSGSAFGAAAAHLAALAGTIEPIEWQVRAGPALRPSPAGVEGWTTAPCTPGELARFLHESGEPVVVLNGRAEVGPRALGGRSIIAAATDPAMKNLLNEVKGRESFRPVAPICLTERAPDIFDPGTPDPHMLFDHQVRAEWIDKIPAVTHLDGTARLQTVAAEDDADLAATLRAYDRLSGIPVLCNTSANHRERGFFPDVVSAMNWGKIDVIWSAGVIYRRTAAAKKSENSV